MAAAATATPCGSWAWTISGWICLRTRASRQAAARSSSVRGARPMRSRPSAARRRSSPCGCATSTVRWPRPRRPSTVSSAWFWPPRQVRAVSMWSESIALGHGTAPALPQLGQLQEDVPAVHRRDHQAGGAGREAAAEDVVAQEGERRMDGDLQQRRVAAAGGAGLGGQRRVAIDLLQVFGEIAVAVVQQLAAQLRDVALDRAPIRARCASRPTVRPGDRRGAAASRDTSRWRAARGRRRGSRAECGSRAPPARRRAAPGSPPPAPARRARRRRSRGSSRASPGRRRGSSAGGSRASPRRRPGRWPGGRCRRWRRCCRRRRRRSRRPTRPRPARLRAAPPRSS